MAHTALTFRGSVVDDTDSATYSFDGLDIGSASAYRTVVACVGYSATSVGSTLTLSFDGGATNATRSIFYAYSGYVAAIFTQRITTGTTVDVRITTGQTNQRMALAWFTLKPEDVAPVSSQYDYNYSTSATMYLTANGAASGNAVIFCEFGASAPTHSLSGGDGSLVRDVSNVQLESGTTYFNVSHALLTGATTVQGMFSGSAGTRVAVAVVFGPQHVETATMTERTNLTEAPASMLTYVPTLPDTIEIYDFANENIPQLLELLMEESFGVTPFSRVYSQIVSLSETVLANDTYSRLQYGDASDTVDLHDDLINARNIVATDALTAGDTLTYAFILGPVMDEGLVLTDTTPTKFTFVKLVTDAAGMREILTVAVPAAVAEAMTVDYALSVARAQKLIDSIGLTEALLAPTKYHLGYVDSVRITDVLRRFFGGDVVEDIAVTESIAAKKSALPTMSEGVELTDAASRMMVVRVVADEGVSITESWVLRALLTQTVAEGIELAAAYISPGNSVTTWAINTKSMAVTEYTNYDFNSFAQMDNKYLGASSSGLYELNGDTDAGTDIIADIKSGLMQLGGSRFSSFKAAYLGMRGTGDFVLKVETGDGKTYNYAVVGKDMQTSRVHFGKGLRARYFAFELISTGQDFDLDSIEFIPLVAQRRV